MERSPTLRMPLELPPWQHLVAPRSVRAQRLPGMKYQPVRAMPSNHWFHVTIGSILRSGSMLCRCRTTCARIASAARAVVRATQMKSSAVKCWFACACVHAAAPAASLAARARRAQACCWWAHAAPAADDRAGARTHWLCFGVPVLEQRLCNGVACGSQPSADAAPLPPPVLVSVSEPLAIAEDTSVRPAPPPSDASHVPVGLWSTNVMCLLLQATAPDPAAAAAVALTGVSETATTVRARTRNLLELSVLCIWTLCLHECQCYCPQSANS